jgi:hypothetical protein
VFRTVYVVAVHSAIAERYSGKVYIVRKKVAKWGSTFDGVIPLYLILAAYLSDEDDNFIVAFDGNCLLIFQ